MPRTWTGIIAVEGEPTGDGRMIETGALYWEDGPWALIWDRDDGDHTGTTVGWVADIWRDGQFIMASGELSESEDEETQAAVARVAELLEEGAVGVSIMWDSEDVEIRVAKELLESMEEGAEESSADSEETDEEGRVTVAKWNDGDELWVTTSARVRHLAIVDTAAFVDTKIALTAALGPEDFVNPAFGANGDEDPRLVAQNPERPEERVTWGCPLTVTASGRVFGHAALWGRCHAGFQDRCVAPPRHGDELSYRRFMHGEAVPGVATGPVTIGTTHADLALSAGAAMDHYADTGRAVADVRVGEDAHGVWVAGRLRPGVSAQDIAELRGSSLSGDWRPTGSALRLVGLLAVNQPGFLVERVAEKALAASITAGPCSCDPLVAVAGDFEGAVVIAVPHPDDAERLTIEGGDEAASLHLTLAWLGDADGFDDEARAGIVENIIAVIGESANFTAEAFAWAVFNPASEERDPASVLLLQSEELAAMREAVASLDASDFPVWFPHITLGYSLGVEPDAMRDRVGPVRFTEIQVAFGSEIVSIPLDGSEEEAEETDAVAAAINRALDARVGPVEALMADMVARDARTL